MLKNYDTYAYICTRNGPVDEKYSNKLLGTGYSFTGIVAKFHQRHNYDFTLTSIGLFYKDLQLKIVKD